MKPKGLKQSKSRSRNARLRDFTVIFSKVHVSCTSCTKNNVRPFPHSLYISIGRMCMSQIKCRSAWWKSFDYKNRPVSTDHKELDSNLNTYTQCTIFSFVVQRRKPFVGAVYSRRTQDKQVEHSSVFIWRRPGLWVCQVEAERGLSPAWFVLLDADALFVWGFTSEEFAWQPRIMSRVRQLMNPAMESLGSAMKGSRCNVSNWAEGFLAARFESWNAIENEVQMLIRRSWRT